MKTLAVQQSQRLQVNKVQSRGRKTSLTLYGSFYGTAEGMRILWSGKTTTVNLYSCGGGSGNDIHGEAPSRGAFVRKTSAAGVMKVRKDK